MGGFSRMSRSSLGRGVPVMGWVLLIAFLALGVAAAGCGGTLSTGKTGSTLQAAGTSAPPTSMLPGSGSALSGDPYFPSNGNGGYDVQHYTISLEIDPQGGRITGDTVVDAVATQDLTAFYLDLIGLEVSAIEVDEVTATFRRDGQELGIVLPKPLRAGGRFSVRVSYSGVPVRLSIKPYAMGWQKMGDTIFTIDEPQGAASWFPVNDTPADKATYEFRLSVPSPYTATANGVLVSSQIGYPSTYIWLMDKPMASYLAAITVGQLVEERSVSEGGVAIRNFFAKDLAEPAHVAFTRTGEVLDYFSSLFGPYPFAVYGVVVPDAKAGAAMESQTLSLFPRDFLEKRMSDPREGPVYLSHELAHQWFGNSVTIKEWDDIWLNEGLASYASWLWLEHDRSAQALEAMVQQSRDTLGGAPQPPLGDPGPNNLFGRNVYLRGALTLHALRLAVGDESFFRLLRAWTERYQYGNAGSADFIALAKETAPQVAPADLDAFFAAWLYGPDLPDLPAVSTGAR
jgi:aminopeptidase N